MDFDSDSADNSDNDDDDNDDGEEETTATIPLEVFYVTLLYYS
jgi:hypothetical protein